MMRCLRPHGHSKIAHSGAAIPPTTAIAFRGRSLGTSLTASKRTIRSTFACPSRRRRHVSVTRRVNEAAMRPKAVLEMVLYHLDPKRLDHHNSGQGLLTFPARSKRDHAT